MEYDCIEPFGDLRANWHAALIAHIIAAAHTSKKRKPPSLAEFMWRDPQTRQEEQTAQALNWFRRMKRNGRSS